MKLKCVRSHKSDFGVNDQRGRQVGYSITVYHCPSANYRFGTVGGFSVNEGDSYYQACVSITRNGVPYGAMQGSIYGRCPNVVFEEAMKKLERSRKASVRKFSKE